MAAETLVNTMHDSLPKVKAQRPVDALRDMDTKASASTLANKVAEVKADKVGESLMQRIEAATLMDT